MPDPRRPCQESTPNPRDRPRLRRHGVIWDADQFSDLTEYWIKSLGPGLNRGCHFINPLYTLSCRKPTPAFYRQAIWVRDAWINLLLADPGPRVFRDEFDSLPPTRKQLTLSGVMYHFGELIPPPTWGRRARAALNPLQDVITTPQRKIPPSYLETHAGRERLAEVSRSELYFAISRRSFGAVYVTPDVTVFGPSLDPTFIAKAREAETDWYRKQGRHLGKQRKILAREADLHTRMLTFHGVLAVNDRAYLPRHWPDKRPSADTLGSLPPLDDSIPLADLGVFLDHDE